MILEVWILLPNQTWVCLPAHKGNLLGCDEGKCTVYCKAPDKESGAANALKMQTPQWVSGRHF